MENAFADVLESEFHSGSKAEVDGIACLLALRMHTGQAHLEETRRLCIQTFESSLVKGRAEQDLSYAIRSTLLIRMLAYVTLSPTRDAWVLCAEKKKEEFFRRPSSDDLTGTELRTGFVLRLRRAAEYGVRDEVSEAALAHGDRNKFRADGMLGAGDPTPSNKI